MIGTLPMADLAPLDYRYALDAALTLLDRTGDLQVVCNLPALDREIRQRIAPAAPPAPANSVLWVEPLAAGWLAQLAALSEQLAPGATLAVIASRPLARLIPERRTWQVKALGTQLAGLPALRRGLRRAGYRISAEYGMHSALSIGLSLLSQQLERRGRPDLGDRLHFAARLHYCKTGPQTALTTVALVQASKERG